MYEKRESSIRRLEPSEATVQLRRGPWTPEEDTLLIHYIASHGEGHWNLLARNSGLKRTGKSCRLRWLNYLKPDVKRGNLSPQEQLMILQLHSMWGNRWSRIAQHLPGRTDNEIKNYWRTRVQKKARQIIKIEPFPSVQSSALTNQNMLMVTTDQDQSPQVSVIQDCCFSSTSTDQSPIASNSSVFIDFPATSACDELGSIPFINPFHNFDEVSTADASDQSSTDELYAILKAYMNGIA